MAGGRGRTGWGLFRREHLVGLVVCILIFDSIRVGYAARQWGGGFGGEGRQEEEDYYELLGVARDADEALIRRAFRKLSAMYHPDRNPGDKSKADKFAKIAEAYEVLANVEKRQKYDRFGKQGVEQGGGMQDADDFDMFGGFFGGGRRRGRNEKRQGASITVPLFASLEQLYKGDVVEAAHRRQIICPQWGDCEKQCSHCGGTGIVITTRQLGPGFVQQMQAPCPKCSGRGKIGTGRCSGCPNGQFEEAEKNLLIDIEKGMPEGKLIHFPDEADEQADHIPGHVDFEIRTHPHDRFERRGDDLYHLLSISLLEALVGVDREIEQLDGRAVKIQKDNVTTPHEHIFVDGEGMPKFGTDKYGKLIVEFWVEFPTRMSDDQKSLVERVLGSGAGNEIPVAGAAAAAAAAGSVQEHAEL